MPIRVLHVVTYMGRGGLETMIMNYYRNIDKEKIQFDFLVHRDFEADYDKEILELGGRIHRISRLNPFSPSYLHQLDEFFKTHKEYSIVHSHLDCMSGIPLKYAKKHGVPTRIAHAHTSNLTKDSKYLLKLFFRSGITNYANKLFACGQRAGEWMFKDKSFVVLNNAINSREYIYNDEKRIQVREALKINSNALVIGHIGRFVPLKNHIFIINVFEEILKKVPNAVLFLVGDGEDCNTIKSMVCEKNINESVIFTGVRDDIPDLLQAMDVFLFPSLYEGLPVSLIEAQAAGLPCLTSTAVPSESKKTDLVYQMDLTESLQCWAEKVIDISKIKRRDTSEEIKKSGFDICENVYELEQFYIEASKKYSSEVI